jgi:hypothetical protein
MQQLFSAAAADPSRGTSVARSRTPFHPIESHFVVPLPSASHYSLPLHYPVLRLGSIGIRRHKEKSLGTQLEF